MTITDNGRRTVDQLVAEARGMANGGKLPSPTALKTALRIGWDRANEVHERASRSLAAERAAQRREARAKLKRLGSKRRSGRSAIVAAPPSREPAAADLAEALAALAQPVPAVVEDGPAKAVSAPSPVYDHEYPIGPMPVPVAAVQAVRPVASKRRPRSWPIALLALPAAVAIWSGWVDMGRLTGFGLVHPFPGIPVLENWRLNTAITLPIGLEAYGAYALSVWLSQAVPNAARRFAKRSAIGSLVVGAAGQVAYHLMVAAGWTKAPWWITTIVACLPVAVLGLAAGLRRLVHAEEVDR